MFVAGKYESLAVLQRKLTLFSYAPGYCIGPGAFILSKIQTYSMFMSQVL